MPNKDLSLDGIEVQNRLHNSFDDANSVTGGDTASWQFDQNPHLRLGVVLLAIFLPLLAVFGRLAYLQAALGDEFVVLRGDYFEEFEPIPTRDGRILAADGQILSRDVERFRVLMHYRWLEEPPNSLWLKRQAYSRLNRHARRDDELVEQTKQQIVSERRELWERIAKATGTSTEEFRKKKTSIQNRVERIRDLVEKRREEKTVQDSPTLRPEAELWWQRAWNLLVDVLTTTPHRKIHDPLVVREELDYHAIADDLSLSLAARLESQAEQFPGLRVQVATLREYPAGDFAPHLIGYRTTANREDIERSPELKGESSNQQLSFRVGRTGVERSYDRQLRGTPGVRRVVRSRRGEIIRTETVREPRLGRDTVLTLDTQLQKQAEEILDKLIEPSLHAPHADEENLPDDELSIVPKGGCIVAINVHTGAVLAAASAPKFDLRLLNQTDPQAWNDIQNDPRHPFFFRAAAMALPPGSVFKTLTAVALLQSGQIEPHDTIHCRGYLDQPDKHRCYIYRHYGVGHNDMNLSDALCQSCNVYFFGAAREVGPQPLVDWAENFGFGQPTGIDLPGEVRGSLPKPKQGSNSNKGRWYSGDTLGLAIGQSRLTVTPLQVARMMAAVANGGYLVTPHVVSRTVQHAVPQESSSPETSGQIQLASSFRWVEPARIPALRKQTLETVREGLEKVVAHPKGTGYKRVRLSDVAIAGKTGTAEVGGGKADHAWFAGYVPAENPRIAFVIVLEHAGSGGKAAGPVARQLVQAMLDDGLIRSKNLTADK